MLISYFNNMDSHWLCCRLAQALPLLLFLVSSSCKPDDQSVSIPASCPMQGDKTRKGCQEGKPPLYLLAMAPYPHPNNSHIEQPSWPGGPAVIPGALLAAEHVNCHPTVLSDYQVRIIISDGGCHIGNRASVNLTTSVYLTNQSDGSVVGIIGGACSESTFAVARLVNNSQLSLIQIAPSATSPMFILENGLKKYRNTMRLTVNALVFVEVFKEIIKNHKMYSEIAILYDAERSYMVSVSSEFGKALEQTDVKVTSSQPLLDSYLNEPLEALKNHNRLIFVFAGANIARKLLCIAYQKGMLHPNYQFIFINRRVSNFKTNVHVNDSDTDEVLYFCTEQQMTEALETTVLLFEPRSTRDDDNITISGCTYSEIEKQYNMVLEEHKEAIGVSEVTDTEYQNAYYDSTWALALSLNASQPLVNLSTYKYGQPAETGVIMEQFFRLSFEGATGKVTFSNKTYDNQDVAIVDIKRYKNGTGRPTLVAYHSGKTRTLTVLNESTFINDSIFRNPPQFIHPPIELGYFAIAVAILVGLGIGVLHYLNGTLGDIKLVKATSWQLNHLIYSGCYLLLLGVIAYACLSTVLVAMLKEESPDTYIRVVFGVFCNIQVWVSTCSFSLIFGTICMKTWRIWRIFSHFSSNPIKYAADYVLIGTVVLLVVIDTLYLLIWTSIDPLVMLVHGNSLTKIAICHGDRLHVWLPILLTYKALVILVVLYLSISTRKVNKQEFKQTKSINSLIYILILVTILGIAPYAIVASSQTFDFGSIVTAFVFYSGAFVFVSIMCATFVFLPPIYPSLVQKWKRWKLSQR